MNQRNLFSGNNWWGKIAGALLGFLMAGPVGALIGLIIGNVFDRGLSQHFSRPHWYYHAERRKSVQRAFFQATFLVLGYIAKVDGHVSSQEIRMVLGLMDEMRLSTEKKEEAKKLFNKGKDPGFNLGQALTLLKENCHDNPDLLRLFIDIQYRAARINGLNKAKIDALNTIFLRLGFAPLNRQYQFYEDFGQQYQQYKNYQNQSHQQQHQQYQQHSRQSRGSRQIPLAEAYAILEIPQSASKQEVKKAYRRLMSRNHPDKLIAQGLPEDMIKMATNKTQTISKAYDQICASKGW